MAGRDGVAVHLLREGAERVRRKEEGETEEEEGETEEEEGSHGVEREHSFRLACGVLTILIMVMMGGRSLRVSFRQQSRNSKFFSCMSVGSSSQ